MKDDFSNAKNGTKIYVKNNDVGRAMRKLKRLMQQEKVFQELKQREFYEKPSLKRKRARASAIKRWKKYLDQKAAL